MNLTAEQQAFLKDIHDPMFRQTVRDFMVNQQFRKDYWVKGARQMSALDQAEALRAQRVVLTTARADVPLTVTGVIGEAKLTESVYQPVLDVLADHQPHTIGSLAQAVKAAGVGFAQLLQAVMVLTGAGHLSAAQDDAIDHKAKKRADQINKCLMLKSRSSNDLSYLASPITGGGVTVGRFAQLFLLAMQQGKKKPEEWAQFVWQILAAQSQKLVKEGKTLETEADNLAELTEQAKTFANNQLPILKALHIA